MKPVVRVRLRRPQKAELLPAPTPSPIDVQGRPTIVATRVRSGSSVVAKALEVSAGTVAALAVLALVAVVLTGLIGRELFNQAFPWVTDVSTLCLEVISFIGGAIAFRRGDLASFEALAVAVKRRWATGAESWVDAIRYPLVIVTCVALFDASVKNVSQQSTSRSTALNLPGTWFALPLTVGLALIVLFALATLVSLSARSALRAVAAAAVVVVVVWLVAHFTGASGTTSFVVAVVTVVLGLCMGVPVAFALGAGSLLFLEKSHFSAISAAAQGMQFGVTNFLLLAIPAFLLAGLIIARTGLGGRIIDLGRLIVGRLPGGLLHVAIGGMYLFSGISGSKLADVAAVGGVMKEQLVEEGHTPGESSAILSASAVMGEAVPPSIPLLVLGSITTLSISKLLVTGLGPAAVVGICLSVFILVQYWRRRKRTNDTSEPQVAPSQPSVLPTVLRSIPALAVPVILVGGIIGGYATPSEVSCVAVGIAVVTSFIDFRTRPTGRDYYEIIMRTVSMAGMVLLIVAAAEAFSFVFAASEITTDITNALTGLSGRVEFLLVSIVCLVLLGTILEGIAAVILFGPILVPIAIGLGVNGYQYGILLILATGLGSFLPPFGVGVYGACSVMGATVEETTRPLLKYACVILAALLIVAFVPEVSLGLGQLGL